MTGSKSKIKTPKAREEGLGTESNWLDHFNPPKPFAVALSGGADSMALLWACHLKWPGQVRAVHVNHGLQKAADEFQRHCEDFCSKQGIPFVAVRVNAHHLSGQSPEDAARRARYQALEQVLCNQWGGEVKDIAIAQHADDQVETVLLALSRGSGLPGLSGMREQWTQNGITFHRPVMQVSAIEMKQWARSEGLAWVEDPTNDDEGFTRNKIRKNILPPLLAAFPNFRQTLARSASHIAQAQRLLEELAKDDLAFVGIAPHIKALQGLSEARRSNVLRFWLAGQGCRASTSQLRELNRLIMACQTKGHDIQLKVGESCVVRKNAVLELVEYRVLPNHRVK